MSLQGSEMALDAAQIERSQKRAQAIMVKGKLMGYKFIPLVLKEMRKRRVSGVDILHATSYSNAAKGGVTDYDIELRGGEINFVYDEILGEYREFLLDTDKNRQFLASHWEYKFWEILDKDVEKDVEKRYSAIIESMKLQKTQKIEDKEVAKDVEAATTITEKKEEEVEVPTHDTDPIESEIDKFRIKGKRRSAKKARVPDRIAVLEPSEPPPARGVGVVQP